MKGKKPSEETRAKISNSKAGKPKPKGSGRPFQPIEVIDIKNNITTNYNSLSAAALALNIRQSIISKYFSQNQKSPYKSRYIF